jgi:hypothetical protein
VASPVGRLRVIEQKSGFLEEAPDGLVKVYARKPLTLIGWVDVQTLRNYRAPRDTLRMLERIPSGKLKSNAASSFDDSEISAFSYATATPAHATREVANGACAAGFQLDDIVVLSF